MRFANESFLNKLAPGRVALGVQWKRSMPKHTSLGELITALYDAAADELDRDEDTSDEVVAACTIDVLLRNGKRNRKALAELVLPLAVLPN